MNFPKGAWTVCRFKRGVFKKVSVMYLSGLRTLVMTPWLIGIKYPKQITMCCANTVMLLIIVIVIKWKYYPKKIPISGLVKV